MKYTILVYLIHLISKKTQTHIYFKKKIKNIFNKKITSVYR